MDKPNHRKHPRVDLFFDAKYVSNQRALVHANLLNLSVGGIALLSDRQLPRGRGVEVGFDLHDNEGKIVKIRTECLIRHSKRSKARNCWESGLEFTGLSDKDLVVVHQFVERELGNQEAAD